MPLTGLVARIAYAVLAGIVAFIVIYILGVFVAKLADHSAGLLLEHWAPIIGLLFGLWYFFARPTPTPPAV